MEKQVIFRDYMEQQAQDHNDIQTYSRAALDHLVADAVTATRRYAGFNVVKTAQTEIQIAPGRFYDVAGAVFLRSSTTVQSLIASLPAVAQRKVLISVFGSENETDVEERDFLVDVDTGRTEPDAVATTRSRDAVIAITAGTESSDPQAPATPIGHAAIAYVTLDPTQVVSVQMLGEFQVASTEVLDTRADALETFRDQIGPRVASLASDLAALAALIRASASQFDVGMLFRDLAEVKEKVGLPATYSQYGADYFIEPSDSDIDDGQSLGYDALTEMGARFAAANSDIFEISLFSANDPNAAYQGGLLLPKYTSEVKLTVNAYHDDLGIAQYGYQTYELVERKIKKERLRYGGGYTQCTNGAILRSQQGEVAPWWLPNFQTFQQTTVQRHGFIQVDNWWHDTWTESYWELETIDHTITGAQIAQTFLVANDMWATRLGFYVTAKAAQENIVVSLCEVTNGMPDLDKVILHQVHNAASIVVGWNRVDIVPTFLERGKRYAIVLTSNANHRIGMAYGQRYLDGTFFYSTDGAYYLGDLMKDMLFEVWGAKFNAAQATIEFAPINLDGGLRNIDITAGTIVPASCEMIYEMRPNGSGEWQPLTVTNVSALNGAPPLCQFRARFIGTRDVQAGLMLTGSRVYVSRPKTAFKHISEAQTLATPSSNIYVRCMLERFDETPHDFTCKLRVGAADVDPVSVVDEVIDANLKRINRTFRFTPASTANFTIQMIAATNSPANVFHVAARTFWSL
ncbi:hypothetical protein [Bradyrhizobium valentinum]|uniref:Uncharacterized protein n=1 Tax=Bradyrhizobium valentinum TaxID=1518501 RepID=A0A0R3KUT8_9BRAD|nr:hypothetical protein [Bradyrhizobium valentinum]KRQ99280.1 hypothetical protein CP49_11835 [Bradyrhizobium valentinum]